MIACEKRDMWQHSECVGSSTPAEGYICAMCGGKPQSPEVILNPQPAPYKEEFAGKHTYYLSLLRDDDLQIRQGEADTQTWLKNIMPPA